MRELLCQLLSLYVLVIFVRIVLSWFPSQPGGALERVSQLLYAATEPLLGAVRRVLPPMGPFDLSPIIVILGLQIVVGRIILGC
jgi:YggT family protein